MIQGHQQDETFGYSVATAGDVNGDGFADVVIGAPGYSGDCTNEGRVLVYYGSVDGLRSEAGWTAVGGRNDAEFGKSVGCAGDVNGDGFADVIVGAPFHPVDGKKTGRVACYFGSKNGLDQESGWVVNGEQAESRFGWSVSTAGDVNRDGYSDILVGAPYHNAQQQVQTNDLLVGFSDKVTLRDNVERHEGRVYLFTGATSGPPVTAQWIVDGPVEQACFGRMVAPAGDVNGDGYTDVMVGAAKGAGGRYYEGLLSVYLGASSGLGLYPSWANSSGQQWSTVDSFAGTAGDVNGDGFDDVVVGCAFYDNSELDEGRVSLYYGSASGLEADPVWSEKGGLSHAWLGSLVGTAGDVNSDGFADIMVGAACISDQVDRGLVYVGTNIRKHTNQVAEVETGLQTAEPDSPYEFNRRKWSTQRSDRLRENVELCEKTVSKLIRHAEDTRNYEPAYGAEWCIGLAKAMGLGDLDEAIAHFARAQHVAEAHWRYVNPESRRPVSLDIGILMEHQRCRLVQQGKAARAYQLLAQMESIYHRSLKEVELDSSPRSSYYHAQAFYIGKTLAEQLKSEGRFKECRARLTDLLERAEALDDVRSQVPVLSSLTLLENFLENREEAIAYAKRLKDIPANKQWVQGVYFYQIRYATCLAERDGVTDEIMAIVDKYVAKLEAVPCRAEALMGGIMKCGLLHHSGKTQEALTRINEIIATAGEEKYILTRSTALLQRAKYLLELGYPLQAGKDCLDALVIRRRLGLKDWEPVVYELYAECQQKLGQYEFALKTWNAAFDLCESLNLHFRSLHMLMGILKLYVEIGNGEGMQSTWARIQEFIAENPDMPKPTRLRYYLAKLEYLRAMNEREELAAAYKEIGEFVKASRMSEYETRKFREYDADTETAGKPTAMKVVKRSQPALLDPVEMVTRVAADELARGRFLIYNPSLDEVIGTLALDGVRGAAWSQTGLVWKVSLNSNGLPERSANKISIPPGEAAVVFLEAQPAETNSPQVVRLQWDDRDDIRAEWEYSMTDTPFETAVVTASYAEENPFYYTLFYHEIYYRGADEVVRNLRVTTSVPSRVELLSSYTGDFLAIDANGDGDFEDAGDVMYQDGDLNGYPDLTLSPEHDTEAVELRVFPGTQTGSAEEEIDITIYIEENGSWHARGVDTLLPHE